MIHPSQALFDAEDSFIVLPVCDHYAGVEIRMHKSLALQSELGPVFDVTLDAEDGAPVGGELDHAHLIADLATSSANVHGRVGVRVHPLGHPAFEAELDILIRRAGHALAYVTVPKVQDASQAERACEWLAHFHRVHGVARKLPVHVLIETHGALRDVRTISALPQVECLSFGLMDFISAHRGAIPATAMSAQGQFTHPLVQRAKLEIAAACHASGKVPSHCVVTEFNDVAAVGEAARRASRELGYGRMWSIHPSQIRPIVAAFAPEPHEIEEASQILLQAQQAGWAPIAFDKKLHDRASYRYYWHLLQRAHRTAQPLGDGIEQKFFTSATEELVRQ
jgi:citrate lyase subunit beta / citryl-CoA lyase